LTEGFDLFQRYLAGQFTQIHNSSRHRRPPAGRFPEFGASDSCPGEWYAAAAPVPAQLFERFTFARSAATTSL